MTDVQIITFIHMCVLRDFVHTDLFLVWTANIKWEKVLSSTSCLYWILHTLIASTRHAAELSIICSYKDDLYQHPKKKKKNSAYDSCCVLDAKLNMDIRRELNQPDSPKKLIWKRSACQKRSHHLHDVDLPVDSDRYNVCRWFWVSGFA